MRRAPSGLFICIDPGSSAALRRTSLALQAIRAAGLVGDGIAGTDFRCEIEIGEVPRRLAAGEETILLSALEGRKPAQARVRPPAPEREGLNGKPATVADVEVLAIVPAVLAEGGDFVDTRIVQLAGSLKRTGCVEVPVGIPLSQIVNEIAGGPLGGKGLKAVQIGGPSGGWIPASELDVALKYEELLESRMHLDFGHSVCRCWRCLRGGAGAAIGGCCPQRRVRQMHLWPRGNAAASGHSKRLHQGTRPGIGSRPARGYCRGDERRRDVRQRPQRNRSGADDSQSFPQRVRSTRAREAVPGRGLQHGGRGRWREGGSMIRLKIDGKDVEVNEGTTVLNAALGAGIYVPHLCDHPDLKPAGACRLCLVEVKGVDGFPASCHLPAEEGMEVETKTPRISQLRQMAMELLLSDHPEECSTCTKYLNCELQSLKQFLGTSEHLSVRRRLKYIPMDATHPLFNYDFARCVNCGRCVRACDELRGADVLKFVSRGEENSAGIEVGKSWAEAGCRFCGACVEVCPTGAIMDKPELAHGKKRKDALLPCRANCPAESTRRSTCAWWAKEDTPTRQPRFARRCRCRWFWATSVRIPAKPPASGRQWATIRCRCAT